MTRTVTVSGSRRLRLLAVASLALLGGVLLWHTARFAAGAVTAVRYRFGIEYGEGIVWEQLRLMAAGTAYGDITSLPAIVFHYPPGYHVLAGLAAAVTGADQLMAGRAVAVLATLATAVLAGAIAYRALRPATERLPSLLCAAAGALLTLTYLPVVSWAVVMRVDMPAVAFAFLGVLVSFRAPARPWLVHAAAACFVAAVYTKQSTIAAPAATFLVLGLVRPRLALAGIASCLVQGGILLAVLTTMTGGGFLRHIVLYNVNRIDLQRIWLLNYLLKLHRGYVLVVGATALAGAWMLLRDSGGWAGLRRRLAENEHDRIMAIMLVYLALTTVLLVAILKSGAAMNYCIEWMCVWSVFLAFGLRPVAEWATGSGAAPRRAVLSALALGVPFILAVQVSILPYAYYETERPRLATAEQQQVLETLVERIRAATAPVVASDMVLLLRAGKPLQLEPAIIAELTSTGQWDETAFLAAIEARRFAFFITEGGRGSAAFAQRYTPAVGAAIARAYPREEQVLHLVLHLPAS